MRILRLWTTPAKISLATLDGKIQQLQWYVKCAIHSKYAVCANLTNIYAIWYIKCDNTFQEIGMGKYSQNIFSCTFFWNDKLIEMECKFAYFGSSLKFHIKV